MTILGMSLAAFTQFHVTLSLIGIASGLVVVLAMLSSQRLNAVAPVFLTSTALTSLTGFLFPFHGITPGIVVGLLSMLLLAVAILARYPFHLAGPWRATYVVTSVMALWFNVFIFIVQSFEKIPALHALAPTQSEAPFKIVQLAALLLFFILGIFAVRKFHPRTLAA